MSTKKYVNFVFLILLNNFLRIRCVRSWHIFIVNKTLVKMVTWYVIIKNLNIVSIPKSQKWINATKTLRFIKYWLLTICYLCFFVFLCLCGKIIHFGAYSMFKIWHIKFIIISITSVYLPPITTTKTSNKMSKYLISLTFTLISLCSFAQTGNVLSITNKSKVLNKAVSYSIYLPPS